jgi:hypothetical protein
MATFYDIYQNYLQNPYSGVNALPGVNPSSGIMNTNTISPIGGDGIGEVSSVSPVGSVSNVGNVGGFGNVDTSARGIAGLAASGLIGGIPGLAANVVGQMIGMPSLSEIGKATMNALGFGDSSSTGTANATDTGDMGSEAANNAATDAANASVGAGDGSSSDGGSTGSCGSFKNGGYITGASVRPNLNIGGRVRMAGGGVSQGLDYLMGIERRGYAEGGTGPSPDAAETYSEYKARMLEALRKSHGGQKTAYTDVQPDGSSSGISRDLPIEDYFNYMLADAYALGFNPNTGLKFGVDDRGVLTDQYKFKQEMADFKKNSQTTPTMGEPGGIITDGGLKYRINADGSRTLLNTATEQTTPTEDFSDYLNTTTINTNAQTKPTVAEQIMSPEDALTPLTPDINPLQQHFDQNQMLKDAVARGEITPEQYNVLGGYDVQQTLSPGNPVLGGIGNLIGSTLYNAAQSSLPSNNLKDSFGNVIYEDTPFIIGEDANTIYSQTPRASQLLRDIPGDVMRNVQGGLGLISPELKQTYQDIIQQRAPANITEHINTAISSFNPFQQQQYMNYAVQNPDQAIAAAQRNKDFLAATQKNTNPATPAPASMADGGRVFYLQGGLASLLG